MSKTKRFYFPELYAELPLIEPTKCDHTNYDDYFERCEDCYADFETVKAEQKHINGVDFDYQCIACGEWKNDSEFESTGTSETCKDCEKYV